MDLFKGLFTRLLRDDPDTFHRFVESLPKPVTEHDLEVIDRMRKRLLSNLESLDKLRSLQPEDPKLN